MQTVETLLDLLINTELPALEGFGLDHINALSALSNFTAEDLEITQISATQVAAKLGDYTLTLSGGQLAPVGSLDDLLHALDTAFADGSMRQLRLSDAAQDLVSFDLTDVGYVLRSGDQALDVVAQWPGSLSEIASTAGLLTSAQNFAGLANEDRRSLISVLDTFGVRQVTLRDADQTVFDYLIENDTTTLSSGATKITVSEAQEGIAKTFRLQLEGNDLAPVSNFESGGTSLDNFPYTIPEIITETGLDYTTAETDRAVLLGDHTYINYTLEQSLLGPYTFSLNIKIDEYYTDTIATVIAGTDQIDVLTGSASDELFIGGGGDDLISGGEGQDAARFAGLSGHFSVDISAHAVTIQDRRTNEEGTDTLNNIETLKFDDVFIPLGDLDWVARITPAQVNDLVALYIAYFGRAPDAQGMLFWLEAQDAGLTLSQTAALFAEQPELDALFDGTDTAAGLVDAAYANVLGRAADTEGARFWANGIESGAVDPATFILFLIDGAGTEDASYLADLTTIGSYYALEKGLGQVDEAAAIIDIYANGERDLQNTLETVDLLHQQAVASNDTFLISLSGVLPDPFTLI